MKKQDTTAYGIYYHTGGTENFKFQAAIDSVAEIVRGGRPAHYEKASLLDNIGLPETFEPGEEVPR